MTKIPLGEVVIATGGGTPRKSVTGYYGGDIPWVTPKDMKRHLIGESEVTLTSAGVDNSPAKLVPEGTVLVVVRSGVLKHTLPVALTTHPVTVNQDIKALTPRDRLDPAYLARMIKALQPTILRWVRATTADNFPIRSLLDLEVDIPPLPEQRRIAAILDHADGLRAKRRQALAHLDSLSQSIFHDMFGDRRPSMPLADAVADFRYGTSNKSGRSGSPTLRIPNVLGGTIDTSEIKTVEVSAVELERLTLTDGDLLFVRSNGNPDNVGRCAVFTSQAVAGSHDGSRWIYASYLIRARLNPQADPMFLATYLASQEGRRRLRSQSKTSAGQYNINIEGIGSVEVPEVDLSEQRKFASRAVQITALRSVAKRALAINDSLFASLQARAFRGEL